MNIEQLREALETVQGQMRGRDSNNPRESAELDNLKRDEARLLAQIQQLEEQNQQVETKIAEAQTQVTQSFDTITAGDQTLTLGDLALNEPARMILSTYFSQYVTKLTEQHAKETNELKAENEQLQVRYDNLYEDNNTLRGANAQLQLEVTLMTAQRDAAATELDNEKKETTQLKGWVEDLRSEIALGAREAVKVVTNLDGNLGEMMKQFKELLPAVYNVQEKDRLTLTAQLASTGETVEVLKIYFKGTYREVTAEEAERFRAEQASQPEAPAIEADPIEQTETPVPSVIDPPALPSEQTGPAEELNTVPGDTTDGEVVPKTLEERVKALEAVVFAKTETVAA